MDASPHRWFGRQDEPFPMIEIVDDCSRVITGARLYPREILPAYLELLSKAFEQYGLPLAMYVDYPIAAKSGWISVMLPPFGPC
jgi:hypothetical protein